MPLSDLNSTELFWEKTGTASDVLVLAHGSWNDHHAWDRMLPVLTQKFRVVTYDRRGHSASKTDGRPTVQDHVDDLAALIEAQGAGPVHLVGSSSGATIVLNLAATRPDLIRAVLVHEPALVDMIDDDPSADTASENVANVIELLSAQQWEAGARTFIETVVGSPGAWDRLPDALRQVYTSNAPTFLAEAEDPDSRRVDLDALRKYTGPILITRGETGPPQFGPIIDMVAKTLTQAEQQTIPQAGHVPHTTHPEPYAAIMAAFFGRH